MSLEQEDYIMRQIHQLGQVLARMLAHLINIKQVPDAGLSLDEIKQIYKDELDLSLDLVQQTSAEDLIELLKTDFSFIEQHLEQMAEILSETADIMERTGDNISARDVREKTIILLENLQNSSGVYSLERVTRISSLKKML